MIVEFDDLILGVDTIQCGTEQKCLSCSNTLRFIQFRLVFRCTPFCAPRRQYRINQGTPPRLSIRTAYVDARPVSSSIAPDADHAHQEADQTHSCSYILCPHLARHLGLHLLTVDLTRLDLDVAGLFRLPLQCEPCQAIIPILDALTAEKTSESGIQ